MGFNSGFKGLMVIEHAEECNNCTTASKSFVMKQDV